MVGCDDPRPLADSKNTGKELGTTHESIRLFCGDCHAQPLPDSFERDVWYEEVRLGYEFYARSGRSDLKPPRLSDVVSYYRERAPETLQFPSTPDVDVRYSKRFRLEKIDWQDKQYVLPAVASITWTPVFETDKPQLVICDMRDGSVSAIDLRSPERNRAVLARLQNPCRVTACDLDEDGFGDLVVADLGSFLPFDHVHGQVVFLRRDPAQRAFAPLTIQGSVGRVAEVIIDRFSDTGNLDILFAEFGHRQHGSIRMLSNLADPREPPRLVSKNIDNRPGTLQLLPHDWNGDGKLDFAALTSQEYECIDIYINRGTHFQRQLIWQAPDLTFGCVGLSRVDLDRDGDDDLLLVNGDSFDNTYANTRHGIQWLENLGDLEFRYHRIADLPCASNGKCGDIDGDGDLDIVCVTNMPGNVKPLSLRRSNPASIVILEQTQPLQFEMHTLERGSAHHAALEVADFDSDGDLDFATGAMLFDGASSSAARITIWWNERE